MKSYLEVLKNRRSHYDIGKESTVSDDEIEKLVQEALLHSPTAFNMQSGRVVLLFGKKHDQVWDIAMDSLRAIVPAEHFAPTESKIQSFKNGYGTVLFYDDTAVTDGFAQQFATYKENFPIWAQQANGILQANIWCLLEEQGLGCSLQHYNPLIDEEVAKAFDIPKTWKLIGQMPFGKPNSCPGAKEFQEVTSRYKKLG